MHGGGFQLLAPKATLCCAYYNEATYFLEFFLVEIIYHSEKLKTVNHDIILCISHKHQHCCCQRKYGDS